MLFGLLTLCTPYLHATSAIGVGARLHTLHSIYADLPYQDDDLSYTIAYEYHDAAGYWQLMVAFTPEVGESEDEDEDSVAVQSVITPQLNLLIEDQIWLAGVGILGDYIETEEDSEWSDMYWQVMLGICLPLGAVELEILAYYPFENWDTIGDFDSGDIDYGATVKFLF